MIRLAQLLVLILIVYLCVGPTTKAELNLTVRRGTAAGLRVLADRLEAGLPIREAEGGR